MWIRFFVIWTMFALSGLFVLSHEDKPVAMTRQFTDFPLQIGEWHMTSRGLLSKNEEAMLNPADYLMRRYANPQGNVMDVYVSYHDGQQDGGIHSPRNCLPGSGWQLFSSEKITVNTDSGPVEAIRAEYAKGLRRNVFYYWFDVRGKAHTSEYSFKLAVLSGSLFMNRSDATFIRLSVPATGKRTQQDNEVTGFISEFYPLLRSFLPEQ